MKYVYLFEEGHAGMKDLLGGKGANLAEMARAGLPVPPGFTITTEACNAYLANNGQVPAGLIKEVHEALETVEGALGRRFGDTANPLLVSVRSGAKISMPGMMETVLNLGLNSQTLEGLIRQSGNPRFAYDSYRRFIQMFSSVVLELPREGFEELLESEKKKQGVENDIELDAAALQRLTRDYLALVQRELGQSFPEDPIEQLQLGIEAVFRSWNIPRAVAYRNFMKIDHDLGTAVNVQAMVFGNMGSDSATGVAFTRNPSTGEPGLYGEYLANAQGEDVVAGIRTPKKLAEMAHEMPEVYRQFKDIAEHLERHYRDVQDMEFTIEKGRLFMLQTRTAKRTVQAAVKTAADMAGEGLITREDALLRVDANQLPQLLLPGFDPLAKKAAVKENRLVTQGLNASPGAATGKVVFDPDEAEALAKTGEKVILVRHETCPDDVHGMIAAQGVLTNRGGNTSHAAVVARGMGKPCVTGCETCKIDYKQGVFIANGMTIRKGETISIDGTTGEVFRGEIALTPPSQSAGLDKLMQWADTHRVLGVRANADTPEDASRAIELGAKGIGLCRTEHMFMAPERLPIVQLMILAETPEARQSALDKLLPMQRSDFIGIFKAMNGYPVTVRLLDPPLHEFLPNLLELQAELHQAAPSERERLGGVFKKVCELSEANPMMGFRGCRLGLVYPEIYDMQVRAILEAACELQSEGYQVYPEIMIPLIGHVNELKRIKERLVSTAEEVLSAYKVPLEYRFGTMIEVPRAALTADEIAGEAEFFSFGTNDLTQMAYGFSRDDAEGKFLARYLETGIIKQNPFETIDQPGVGQLVRMACEKGRAVRPDLKLGLCGEHGGEAESVIFCHRLGLDYVSCSPFRVPVARLAGAQAAIRSRREISKAMATEVAPRELITT